MGDPRRIDVGETRHRLPSLVVVTDREGKKRKNEMPKTKKGKERK